MEIVKAILQVAGALALCTVIGAGLPLVLCWAYAKAKK